MFRLLVGLAFAAVLGLTQTPGATRDEAGQATVPPTAPRRGGNPEAAKIANPSPPTSASVAAGKRTYQRLCVQCHGPEAKGDGGGAGAGGQPADLTGDHWDYGASDGEIWNLVNYLRSIGPRK
jgi:mono/diheme cytochrome c family protein